MQVFGLFPYFCTIIQWYMGKKSVVFFLFFMLFSFAANAANRKFTLVIDPGHGGKDAGALGAFSKEKDINLTVALAFGRYVEQNCPDVRVIYTRKTDVFIPLKERADMANKNKADLFVSVHTNALPGGKLAYGMETYTLGMHRAADNLDVAKRENSVILVEKDYKQSYQGFNPNSSESYIMFEFMQDKNMANSVDMAKMVQRETCAAANRPDKGVHQAGFLVLRETSMPGCLIELGFITTAEEERLLNDSGRIDNIAMGIYRAFEGYKNKYYNHVVVPYKAAATSGKKIQDIVPDSYKHEETTKKTPVRTPAATQTTAPVAKSTVKTEPVAEVVRPESTATASVTVVQDAGKSADASGKTTGLPIFKVQILASARAIRAGSPQLKGLKEVDFFNEGNMVKYTYGASTNYNEINKLRREIADRFPDAFVVAFKDGVRMDINKAIREFTVNKIKK